MPILFVLLKCLFAGLQKTVTFRAEWPHFASKLHSKPHLTATMWGQMWGSCPALPQSVVRLLWTMVCRPACPERSKGSIFGHPKEHKNVGEMWGFSL
jgi:hypothetical protein